MSLNAMEYRVNRIHSFLHGTWKHLAEAGFFCHGDSIECAFCGIVLSSGDEHRLRKEHIRKNPKCPFLLGIVRDKYDHLSNYEKETNVENENLRESLKQAKIEQKLMRERAKMDMENLRQELKQAYKEGLNQGLKQAKIENETLECGICMNKERNVTFQPCGHFVSCDTCSFQLFDCPICKRKIQYRLETFIS